ncbi:MAG: hypothetical protein J4400_01360 [Candidatus Aenigmarchaeota archaeon]|nr:hypothetical protein [Candidatus Aenigmarchaeota archaeon]
MVSDIVKDFVGSLFVERAKEPGHEGAFDKGVADYFRAGSGLRYSLDEALPTVVNERLPEFVGHDESIDVFRLRAYFRGINACVDLSKLHSVGVKFEDAETVYLEKALASMRRQKPRDGESTELS